ncbi:MAG: membrane protein insertion efficiency factor YidD [Clostridia bacterium]|nr:membrane protein insertion efficiency factor YidD [Clostridia bacterium]MDD4386332.1 membrane protein insertion efficiency factor YidD [Clostridia bacterium]
MIKIITKILHLPRNLGILLINFYQKYISNSFGKRCVFYPTCSEYTKKAILKYGLIIGSIIGFMRILRCNPFSKGGIDYLK